MEIRIDDLKGPGIAGLLREHLQHMAALSPPESIHALDLDGFAPARALYTRYGFDVCGPFDGYAEDPHSVFMTRLV